MTEQRIRKLALPDDVLLSVEKPSRYIGGEYNSCNKDLSFVFIASSALICDKVTKNRSISVLLFANFNFWGK